jgi:hypothetical protein
LYLIGATSSAQYAFGAFGHQCEGAVESNQYQTANTLVPTAVSAADATHLQFTFPPSSHNYQIGDTASVSGVTGSGNPNTSSSCDSNNVNGAIVTAISGDIVIFSGFSNLSGSYSGGTVSPCFRERFALLRYTDTGAFTSLFMPYLKNAPPTRTVQQQACGTQVVQGSETTCFSDTQMTYTNGVVQTLAAYDTAAHGAFSMAVSGGPQEIVNNQGTITWKVDSVTAGARTFTPPAGTWYPDKPLIVNGNGFVINHPGGVQPSAYTVHFTQTPVAQRKVSISFRPAQIAGATQVRFRYNGSSEDLGVSACGTICSVAVLLPLGTTSLNWDYLDVNGNVLASNSLPAVTTAN